MIRIIMIEDMIVDCLCGLKAVSEEKTEEWTLFMEGLRERAEEIVGSWGLRRVIPDSVENYDLVFARSAGLDTARALGVAS